jgi:hypothetical protein
MYDQRISNSRFFLSGGLMPGEDPCPNCGMTRLPDSDSPSPAPPVGGGTSGGGGGWG